MPGIRTADGVKLAICAMAEEAQERFPTGMF
jgi:hypothetical protein